MSVIRSAVSKPVTTALVFLAFAIFGIYSLTKTSVALFPDFDANVVLVMSSYPGASASDVENNLTKLLENTLNSVANLKNLTSRSRENVAIVMLEFKYGTDIDEASNDIRDKLDLINSALPDGASVPVLFKFGMDDMPVLILSATADKSMAGLDRILDDRVVTPLGRVTGVGTVSVAGAPAREIHVYCDPNKLAAYGLSVAGISQIIAAENRNVPSGSIDIGSESFSLRVEKEFKDPSELLDVVVSYRGGQVVYLKDVARVEDGLEEKSQESYTNGNRSAMIAIQKQSGANTVNVVNAAKQRIAEIAPTLPSDIKITEVVDNSSEILNTINSLKETIIITLLVVMLVVFVFLGRWRATFIIVLSIPIALLGSLVYLFATGNTLNIISMSALSIAIGMVVDDAIVVLENISTHLERGEKPKEAAVHATSEVGISVIASTLTMLCVFLPLTMVSGMAGIMFKQLGWIVSIIMIISTTAALTLVPMLCSRMLKAGPKTGKLHRAIFDPIEKGLDGLSAWYSRIIAWAVTHRKTVIFGALAIFVGVLALLAPGLKTEFFPTMDGGRLSVSIELPVGTEQSVTGAFARQICDRLEEEIPEIQVLQYRYGQASSDNVIGSMQNNGSHVISMNVNIGSMEDRKRSSSEIADIIRKDLREYPEVKKATVTEGMGGVGGAASLRLEIYGYDFDETDRIAKEAQAKMLADPAFTQVILSRDDYTPEYQVDFDREKLALNGLNSTTAAAAFSAAMSGSVNSFYREDGDEYNIRVIYDKRFRTSVEDIENILIYTPLGGAVRIKDLGTVVESKVPPTIERKNRERYISVTGIVTRGYALSDGVAVTNRVLSEIDIPNNISTEITGDFEDQQSMFKDLIVLMILIIILVYMVMASQFESFMSPLVIMFSVPFAFIGVILGLRLTGTALGVMAMIGVIILLGIVVKNGIVLIDYTILMRERGMNVINASVTAARSRLRPILMTTLTTVLGMLPMALGRGEGSEMWRSLGMTVCWGLSFSTLITLVLIPAVYCVFATRQEKRKAKKLAAGAKV
ncbi:MAG: efflux RND transporter permease subunit [Bacteroidales bacterium]|jgi:HAE1 family hydrophobic/amphiphilic exporter-1|nr:efflux RND transporter permease subunit [Bacteroidales bacterium]